MNNKFLQIKNFPLRDFPKDLPTEKQKIDIKRNKSETFTFTPKPGFSQFDVTVGDGSKLVLLFAANYNPQDFRLLEISASIGKDAYLHIIDRALGGARIETQAEMLLESQGASGLFTGMYHGKKAEHHACRVLVEHKVPNTHGDVLVRGVYEAESRSVFTGLIKINPGAQQTKSYYRDDILLLDKALAESLPTLEIEANDVKASHGSTTSRINDEQLFYLQSRGISSQQARNLIVAGFLTPALKRVPEALCKPFLTAD